MAQRGYSAEFRRRVLGLVEGGLNVAEIAADLGRFSLPRSAEYGKYASGCLRSEAPEIIALLTPKLRASRIVRARQARFMSMSRSVAPE